MIIVTINKKSSEGLEVKKFHRPEFLDHLVEGWEFVTSVANEDPYASLSVVDDTNNSVWYEGNVLKMTKPMNDLSLAMTNEKTNIHIWGTSGNNTFFTSDSLNETIVTGRGNDVIHASRGNDAYRGGFDHNKLFVSAERLGEVVEYGSDVPGELWVFFENGDYQNIYDIYTLVVDDVEYDLTPHIMPLDVEYRDTLEITNEELQNEKITFSASLNESAEIGLVGKTDQLPVDMHFV